jgi:hypothetical protein
MLLCCLVKGILNCPVQMLVCCFACSANSFYFSLCRLYQLSVYPAGGYWAVCVASWVWALAISTLGFMGAVVPV